MKRFIGRKRIAASTTFSLLIIGGGLAYAYFSTTGQGGGSTPVGSDTPLVITQIPSESTIGDASFGEVLLVPGGPAQRLAISISNPALGDEAVHAVTVSVATASPGAVATYNLAHESPALQAGTSDATSSGIPIPGCLASWFSVTNWSPSSGDLVISGSGTITIGNDSNGSPDATSTLSVALASEGILQDSCKDALIDLKFASN